MIDITVGLDVLIFLALGSGIALGIIICKIGQLVAKDW
jgi:hypothetical protein